MACFTKLVEAALLALMLTSPASARQWWVMEGAEPIDPVHASPPGPLPKRCVVGNGLNTGPAFLYERMKELGDTTAHIEEEGRRGPCVLHGSKALQGRLRPLLPHQRGL